MGRMMSRSVRMRLMPGNVVITVPDVQQENAGGVCQLGQHDAKNTVKQIQLGDRDVVGDHGDGKGNKNGADEQEVQHGLSPEGGKDKGIRRKDTGEQLAGGHQNRYRQRVQSDLHDRQLPGDVPVVIQGETAGEQSCVAVNALQGLEGVQQREQDRDQGHCHQEGQRDMPQACPAYRNRGFSFHNTHSSPQT